MKRATFKIEAVELVRQDTYKVHVNLGKQGSIRVIVYPTGPIAVLTDGPVQWLAADLSADQLSKINRAVRSFSLKTCR